MVERVTDEQLIAELKYHMRLLESGDTRLLQAMTPEEVSTLFRVDHKTVGRWYEMGRIPEEAHFRTPGGHHRYFTVYVEVMLYEQGVTSRRDRKNMIDKAISDTEENLAKRRIRTESIERQLMSGMRAA